MSVKITIGPYRLESYSAGWTTGELKVGTKTDAETGEESVTEHLDHQRYHGTLTQALASLQDRWLRESGAESLPELMNELRLFKAEIAGLFELQIREPDKDRHRRTA